MCSMSLAGYLVQAKGSLVVSIVPPDAGVQCLLIELQEACTSDRSIDFLELEKGIDRLMRV